MSSEKDKAVTNRRIQDTERYMKRQQKIRKAKGLSEVDAHRFHKKSGLTCGNSNCVMCGNPRKFFKEKTLQERKFDQQALLTAE